MLDYSLSIGNEQKGHRPAVVISNPNNFVPLNGMIAVAPITKTVKDGFPSHVRLDDTVKTTGAVLLEHLKWVDIKNRPYKYLENMSEENFQECVKVEKALLFPE